MMSSRRKGTCHINCFFRLASIVLVMLLLRY